MKIFKISQSSVPNAEVDNPRIFDLFKRVVAANRITWDRTHENWRFFPLSKDSQFGASRTYAGTVKPAGGFISKTVPSYQVMISTSSPDQDYSSYDKATVALYFNKTMSPAMDNLERIATWSYTDDRSIKGELSDLLHTELGLTVTLLPHDLKLSEARALEKKLSYHVRLTRRKLQPPRQRDATALDLYIEPKRKVGHDIFYTVTHLETGAQEPRKLLSDKKADGSEYTTDQAMAYLNDQIAKAKANDYVDSTSNSQLGQDNYIPEDTTNWDFNLNMSKENMDISPIEQRPIENKPVSRKPRKMNVEDEYKDLVGSSKRDIRLAQNFEGYFSGNVPDYATQFLGTTSVESSQIESMFGKAGEAVKLVNQFDSSLLYNISFIFNFAKGGAYGVYLSELDRAIKTKALQKELEQKGYKVAVTAQGLTAYPAEDKEIAPDQVQQDIDNIYAQLESKGGTAIGINMSAVLNAAKQDAMESGSNDPEVWQWIAVLHLGGTIVHEAIHAKGSHSEGPSEQSEQAFTQWALPKINEEYKRSLESQGKTEEFSPLTVTDKRRHASSKTWYKTAQMSYYCPQIFSEPAIGSDLQGRFPFGPQSEMGISPWSMLAQEGGGAPIETKLGKQFMSQLPRDLNQEHDSIEEQLRKYTREDQKLDPKASMNELLSEGWDADRGYLTTEGLLDEKRPKPLMAPLTKAASNMTKTATLFGWMNNLAISDGNTIPGLGDRVMAWDDRDESFSQEETWIRQQPRYNPTYDIKGFFFRWIEPMFQPRLFEDMTRDYTNTHPAKRFGSSSSTQVDPEVANILSILGRAKSKIAKGDIATTRFITTEDIMPLIDKLFPDSAFKINVFHYGTTDNQGEIFAVWISAPNVSEESIEKAEMYLQGKTADQDVANLIDGMTGLSKQRDGSLQEIISLVSDVIHSYGLEGFSVVGSYPRDIALKAPLYAVDSVEFRGGWADQCLKIGSLVAEKLGIQGVDVSHNNVTFVYKGVTVNFSGDQIPTEIRAGLQDQGIDVESSCVDLFNRDFTVNMLVYDLKEKKILDPTGKASGDIKSKTLRTFFDPAYICQQNPIVILRALKLKIRHNMEIDPLLQEAMRSNVGLLFDGRYSERDLFIARENVKKEGKKEAEELFKAFGLADLDKIS